MNNFLDRLLKLKAIAKIGITIGLVAIIWGLFYFLVLADLTDEISASKSQHGVLEIERSTYQKRKVEYLAYRNELTQLQEEQREQLKVLPRKPEVPSFLSAFQEQLELAGLESQTFTPEAEQPEELFVRIPIKMEVRGTYHAITKFFRNASQMRRIVNVENLSLQPERTVADLETGTASKIKARFLVVIFRFQDQPGGGGGMGTGGLPTGPPPAAPAGAKGENSSRGHGGGA